MDVMLYEATQNLVPPRIIIVIIVFALCNTGYSKQSISNLYSEKMLKLEFQEIN